MRLLRKAALTRVITPDNVETFIKELLETPETWGKNTIVTKLIFCASGVDGDTLRKNIHLWLSNILAKREVESPDLNELFDALETKPSNGTTTK